ncbi:histidine kinase [Actinoplanes sp. SE50]|uniref:histidine kinase dimerization/phospho-acceptor domain-containing protein n=1 Tax=unclassified Actinoplanes TaxID=2626549 RepID=UPI00023ED2E5|nr:MULTISPECIES: histidine kinase dimerization/phospho-acceptor domain-containing protein [unclassified Actinoplanes]AEV86720.1 hypothetical protein ACPL_5833 [Actinoplanes sp. SE50/110]ATO85118.1 histidine kinase [Actinoplanes sp. SE50]SLM02529.1 two-component system sensor kinase [Actinoplanes sp. SE50/110]
MQLVHAGGWRLLQIPDITDPGLCYRLCRDRIWAGDCHTTELHDRLALLGLSLDDFTTAGIDCCIMVDPSSHIACLRPAEPVDGQAHLPLCSLCRHNLTQMRGFPRHRDIHQPAAAIPHLSTLWQHLDTDHDRRELSHHLRHPIAKILGWAEVLHDDTTMRPAQAHQINVIYQSACDLQQLLDNAASPL